VHCIGHLQNGFVCDYVCVFAADAIAMLLVERVGWDVRSEVLEGRGRYDLASTSLAGFGQPVVLFVLGRIIRSRPP
jgi:hypothetical protein